MPQYCRSCDKYIGEARSDFIELYLCFDCAVAEIEKKNLSLGAHARALDSLKTLYEINYK